MREAMPTKINYYMKEGLRVECYYDDGWYPGVIETCNKDGTFFVRFDDGDVLEDAIAEEIRLLSNIPIKSPTKSNSYDVNNSSTNIDVNTNETTSSSGGRNYGDVLAVFMPMKVDQVVNDNGTGEQMIMYDDADTRVILTQVERFLLPEHDDRYFVKHNQKGLGLDKGDIPVYRLEHILSQASILEHIRTMQTLYRDSEDEMHLEPEFRIGEADQKLPTRLLVEKLCLKRARAIGLCSLCYGDDSLATLRAHIELSNAYALQGLWPQVSEQMKKCSQKLLSISAIRRADASKIAASRAKAFLISKLISRLFRILRVRAASNGGQIALGVTSQIVQEMEEIISLSKIDSLKAELKIDILDLATSLKRFQESAITISSESNPNWNATSGEIEPSWGSVITFLRSSRDCEVMKKWMDVVKSVTLPQYIAVLGVAFQLADPLNKGVAHPRELSKALQHCPATVRIFGIDAVVQTLYEIETEVPLAVVRHDGQVDRILSRQLGSLGVEETFENSGRRKVTYELPVTWDEVLATYVVNAEDDPFESLRIQVLTMLGVCQMFTGYLDESETNLQEAIKYTSRAGLDESAVTCELYNSIAQLMIMKHREWHADKKNRCREEAAAWLSTPEGRKEFQEEVLSIMHSSGRNVDAQGNHVMPAKTNKSSDVRQIAPTREEAKVQAKAVLIRARARHIARQESDPTLPSVEAAFRYLTKTFDLLSKAHGSHHSAIGASCLAVASVQNMVDALEGTEEWLRKALTILQGLKPIPVRALSFARIQLSQVLSRQGRVDEALELLIMAFDFHLEQVRRGLQMRSNSNFGPSFSPQPSPSSLLSPATTTLTQDSHSRSQIHSPASRSRPIGPESPTTYLEKNKNKAAFPVGKDGGPSALGREHAPLPHPSDPRGVSARIAARYNSSEISRALPLRAGRLLYEDIILTLELGDRLTEMRLRVQGPHPAVDQAERTADLAEHAYGWDSPEAVKYRRHVGERCAHAADWHRAVQNLTKSLEGHEMLYGAKDKRTNQVRELLHVALNHLDGGRGEHGKHGKSGGRTRGGRPQSAGVVR